MNDQTYVHRSRNGTQFIADRCDFGTGIDAYVPDTIGTAQIMADVSDMTAHHCVNIWPELNGFAGYDGVEYRIHEVTPR